MKASRALQFTSFILLLTQFTSINSSAQNSFNNNVVGDSSHLNDETATSSTTAPRTDSRKSSSTAVPLEPKALRTRDPRKFGVIDRAYLDVFTILNDDNSCSRFFGGRNAITALTELVLQLKPRYLDRDVAIRMSGETTTIQSQATGFSFRTFSKVEINLQGSFFRSQSPSERHTFITPIYPPNTRETRVVVLLHELGHLVKGTDDHWVLPDDGNDALLSLANTERVVSACRPQISLLAALTPAQQLEMTTSSLVQNRGQ